MDFPVESIIWTIGYPSKVHGIVEMFLNAIPVTPREPIAAPSTPSWITNWEEVHVKTAGVAVTVGDGVGVGEAGGVVFALLPHPVNSRITVTSTADLTRTFTVVSLI